MFYRKYLLLTALFITSLTYPVFAADTGGASDDTSVQQDKNSDFDNWYEPDSAYQSNDQSKQPAAANTASPRGGVDEPRVAPLEDTRQKTN